MKRTPIKILFVSMMLVLLLALVPTISFANGTEEQMTVTASSTWGNPGEVAEITVSLDNNPGIASMKLTIGYDSYLTLTEVKFDSAFGAYVTAPTPYSNPQTLNFINPMSETTANGNFATLTFKISDNAPDKYSASVTLSYSAADTVDKDLNRVAVNTVNGKVDVYHGLAGDVDGNRSVNNKDAILLFQYVSGWGENPEWCANNTIDPEALNVNGDDAINNIDAITLFRYVAGWDVEIYRGGLSCAHSLIHFVDNAATCTESGNIEYWQCEECSKYYSDIDAKNEIALSDTVIAAKGHDEISHEAKAPTCTEGGWDAYVTCSRCDYNTKVEKGELGHDFSSQTISDEYLFIPATCYFSANYYYKCTRCTEKGSGTYTYGDPLPHDIVEVEAKAATCEEAGWDAYVLCNRCGYNTKTEIKPYNHRFSVKVETDFYICEQATCDRPAIYYYKCERCEEAGPNTYTGSAALGHSFTVKEITNNYLKNPATCTEAATYFYKCERCYEFNTDFTYTVGDALGHDFTSMTATDQYKRSSAYCTKAATYYYKCENCDEKSQTYYTYGDPLGHDFSSKTATDAYIKSKATCTEPPICYYKCTRCTEKGTETYEAGFPMGHYYGDMVESDEYIKTPATCTSPAVYYKKCIRCTEKGNTTFTGTTALGHDFTEKNQSRTYIHSDATCNYAAVYFYKCSRCTAKGTNTYTYGNPLGHNFVDGYLTSENQRSEATCTAPATFYYRCSRCLTLGTQYFEHGYPDDHNFVDGYCSNCSTPYYSPGLSFVLKADGTYEVSEGGCSDVNIVIPDTYEGKPVTSIAEEGFYAFNSLKSITIGKNINSIGSWAFRACYSLEAVYITDLAAWCNIDFTDGPSNPLYCAENLYVNGNLLTSLTIPQGITTVKPLTFVECSSITSVFIPNHVTYIDYAAFSGCQSLQSLTIADSVTYIESQAFWYCKSLKNVVIGNGVSSFGETVFEGCNAIESITLPYVGQSKDGSGITSLSYLFGGTNSNDNSLVPATLKNVTINGGHIYPSAFSECNGIETVVLGNSVTGIDNYAFCNCTSLKSISLGSGISAIGQASFANCIALASITIPSSVKSIGKSAFSGCAKLTSVDIGNGVTTIGSEAFNNCTSLVSVTVGNNLTSVAEKAFYGCSSISKVYITNLAAWCNIDFAATYENYINNCYSNPLYYGASIYLNGSLLTSLSIPSNVTAIKNYVFYNCSSIQSVTIASSVTKIGDQAFRNCQSLKEVTIGIGVSAIGDLAFSECANLSSIRFSDTTTWYRTESSDYTGGKAWDISNTANAANYFRSTNKGVYWYKV